MKTNVPESLLRAVCWVESRHHASALNRLDGDSASYGMCQIKLKTARYMGFKGNAKRLMDVQTNVHFAAKYLAYQLDRYNHDWLKAVTAYNRGYCAHEKSVYNRYALKVVTALVERK